MVAHPPGVVSLDEAHAAIEQWEFYAKRTLDSGQRLAVEHMLAETADGRWAARTTGRTMPRQNGKGDEIECVEAWGLTQRAEAIVHTAHEIPTAKSAHARLVGHIEGNRDLRRLLKQVRYANGDQSIEMNNGGVIVYRTRTGAGARGLDDISRLVVDEAQHAHPEQLASSTPILAANPNPQLNFLGSAGIATKSNWWWEMRRRALAPAAGEFAWLEHSAEQVSLTPEGIIVSVRPDVWDHDQWRVANPAFPDRIEAGFLEEQLRTLGADLFAREHLGVWDPDPTNDRSIFGPGVWAACNRADVEASGRVWFGVDCTPERTAAVIVICDESGRIEIPKTADNVDDHRPGLGWLTARVIELATRYDATVAVDSGGPANSFADEWERQGVTVERLSSRDMAGATGSFFDAVLNGTVEIRNHPSLDRAAAGARQRSSGDVWYWARRDSTVDVSPLVAASIARWVAVPSATFEPLVAWR